VSTPYLLVCNTDPTRPVRHWICIFVEDGRGEYFDSFGRRPSAAFERYLNRHCSYWTFNDVLSANFVDTIVCSFACLEVEVSSDTRFNDVLVHGFVCEMKIHSCTQHSQTFLKR